MIAFCVIIEINRLLMALLRKTLNKIQLHKVLTRLETSHGDYITLYIRPSSFPHYINELALQPRYSTYADEIKEAVSIKSVAHVIEA